MRGTLVLCALAAVRAVPDWVSKLRAQPPYSDYDECEWFIGTIYNEIVDDAFDAPSVTLARQPALAKCRLTRTLNTLEVVGMTAVYAATIRNRTDWLAELLARGGDPDARRTAKARGDNDAFPLFVAAQYNYVEAARLLVAAGARQEETMNNGQAAISCAALYGHWEIVALLAESRPDLVDFVGVDEWTGQSTGTPLVVAAGAGEPYAGQIKAQLAMLPPAQRKSAHVARPSEDEADYAKVIWTLVEHGADVNAQETGGRTALMGAAMNGKGLIVDALLGEGADPNKAAHNGMTALTWACEKGHEAVARVLVNHESCDCDARTSSGGTAAIFATYHVKTKALAAVAESGRCDLDAVDGSGEAAVHIAAYNNRWRMLKILAMNGADIDKGDPRGRTPAMFAARHNHAKAIEVLAAHGANLTKAAYDPETDTYSGPHHLALIGQALDVLAALVSAGVDVCVGERPGFRDAVILAMNENLLDSLRFLVEEAGCPVNATKTFNPGEGPVTIQPALHAISFDRVEAFRILAAAGADLDTVDDAAGLAADHDLAPPSLADVAAVASPGILKILKEEYGREPAGLWQVTHSRGGARFEPVDKNAATTLPPREDLDAWRRQRSPLDDPVRDPFDSIGSLDRHASGTISEAIKNADPNYAYKRDDDDGQRVLHVAVQQGYVESVRELLRLGADPTALYRTADEGWVTPLHIAALYGRARIVEILVQDGGVDVDILSADDATALCFAVENDFVRTTQSLLSLGANADVACYGKRVPLIGAYKASIVDALIQHGADVDARDSRSDYKGFTPLRHAAALGKADVVRSLLDAGADVDTKCVRGNTPLHAASINNRPRVVEILLAHGAEVSPANNDGYTPLAIAATEGHIKVVKALLKAGADPSQRLGGGIGKSSAELALEKNHMDVISAMTRADMAANPRRYSSEKNWGPVVAAVLAILGFALIPWMRATFRARFSREDQAVQAARDLLRENTTREPRRRNRNAQAARDREAAARRREQARRDREAAAREAREREAAVREQERLDREAAAEAARAALDCEAAAAREREAWERENLDSLQAMAAWAAASEEKTEEPVGREESKEEPPSAPAGFEIVARVLEHLGEAHLLPIFEAEEINDEYLPDLDPSDLIGLGVSQMTCLTILGAAHSAAKTKKLEAEEVLDNVAKHQSVLEEELREHRAEIKRLRIRELPEDLMCPIMCEIMKDPVLLMEDGHTYERVALEQWFATGARTSPSTSAELDSLATAPNHTVKKLIAALLEEHRGRAAD